MQINITSEFTLNNAHAMARHSALSYKTEFEIKDQLTRWQYNVIHYLSRDQIQCYLAESDSHIIIVFRGTEFEKIEDWITNLNYKHHDFMYGCVHRGFDIGLNKVFLDIKYQLSQLEKKPIFVTGHSQGAALAVLCAARLRHAGIEVQALYTYGQPRIGNKSFSFTYDRFLKARSFRIVNNNDIVTRVPPRAMDYAHTGTLKYFKETGELSGDLSDWEAFLDRLHGMAADVLEWGTDGLKDHDIGEYIRLCGQASEVVEV